MRSVSQSELRRDGARIMRIVEGGGSFVVTRSGVPVATLAPVGIDADLRCERPARRPLDLAALVPVCSTEASVDTLEDLRGRR